MQLERIVYSGGKATQISMCRLAETFPELGVYFVWKAPEFLATPICLDALSIQYSLNSHFRINEVDYRTIDIFSRACI